ncbi:MAG: InlB B-repeat-containing protein [Rectinemataceae bacterium]
MPNIGTRLSGIAMAGFLAMVSGACSLPFPWVATATPKASLVVLLPSTPATATASRGGGSRDIIPAALKTSDLSYRVELSQTGDPIVRDSLAVTDIAVDGLVPGTWDLTVTGYIEAGKDLFQASTSVDLVAGANTVKLTLEPLQTAVTGQGELSLAISWPKGQIDTASAYLARDPLALRATALAADELSAVDAASAGLSIAKKGIVSGTYYLTVDLYVGTALAATVIEVVHIYDYRTSAATIVLDGKISRPPDSPTGLAVASRTRGGIDFSWVDNSDTETGYEFHDGSAWQALSAGKTAYTVSVAPLVTTVFKVRAKNDFGLSAIASYAFAPCFAIYSANTGDKGTVPVDAYAYEAGSSVKVMDIGTMAKTGFAFTGWNTNAGGTGTAYSPADSLVMPGGGMTLYAQWAPNTAVITISLDNPFDDTPGSLDPDKSGLALDFSVSPTNPTQNSILTNLDRSKGESVTITATGGSYTNYKWVLFGKGWGVLPTIEGESNSSAIILTAGAETELAVVTLTLAFGNGTNAMELPLYQYSRTLRFQIVDSSSAVIPSRESR